MKDIAEALAETLSKQKKKPEELTTLNLDSKCKSTHIKGLEACVNLQSLSLCGLGLTSLEGFPRLPKLTRLTLSDNRLTGGLQHLVAAGLTSLHTLDLAGNRITNVEELESLKELKQLRCLDLLECPITKSVPDLSKKLFEMLDELKYLNSYDKEGLERDGDEEEEAEGEEAGEEEFDDGGGEGEEEFEDEEGGEFEEGEKEYAILAGAEAVGEDEEGDYQEEGEGDDEDDEDEEAEGAGEEAAGTKRKREEEGDDEEDE